MAVPSLNSVSRCARMSRLPQCLQRSDCTSLMTCRRSLVGTISCTTMYHMDVISSDNLAVCRFFHACIHCVSGCSCLSPFLRILSSLPPSYVEYFRRAFWMSGGFRHSRGVLCRPCSAHINIDTLTSSVSVLCEGGSPWVHPGSTSVAMSLFQSYFSGLVSTFGRSREIESSSRCQLSPSFLVSSASVE